MINKRQINVLIFESPLEQSVQEINGSKIVRPPPHPPSNQHSKSELTPEKCHFKRLLIFNPGHVSAAIIGTWYLLGPSNFGRCFRTKGCCECNKGFPVLETSHVSRSINPKLFWFLGKFHFCANVPLFWGTLVNHLLVLHNYPSLGFDYIKFEAGGIPPHQMLSAGSQPNERVLRTWKFINSAPSDTAEFFVGSFPGGRKTLRITWVESSHVLSCLAHLSSWGMSRWARLKSRSLRPPNNRGWELLDTALCASLRKVA